MLKILAGGNAATAITVCSADEVEALLRFAERLVAFIETPNAVPEQVVERLNLLEMEIYDAVDRFYDQL